MPTPKVANACSSSSSSSNGKGGSDISTASSPLGSCNSAASSSGKSSVFTGSIASVGSRSSCSLTTGAHGGIAASGTSPSRSISRG